MTDKPEKLGPAAKRRLRRKRHEEIKARKREAKASNVVIGNGLVGWTTQNDSPGGSDPAPQPSG